MAWPDGGFVPKLQYDIKTDSSNRTIQNWFTNAAGLFFQKKQKTNVNWPLVGVVNLTSYLVAKYYGDIISEVEHANVARGG